MIDIASVYNDVAKDNVNSEENGTLSFDRFNRMSRRAELRLIDWLTGDISGAIPPHPYLTQKNKDWVQRFIKKSKAQTVNGEIEKPEDYYQIDNMALIGSKTEADCESEEVYEIDEFDTPIDLLDGKEFHRRCNTHIKSKRPSIKKPIAKLLSDRFEFRPKELGSIAMEYIRYPKFGAIAKKTDPVYNNEVIDTDNSTNYEWDESARELLVWFITDTFAIHSREQMLSVSNKEAKKTVRE